MGEIKISVSEKLDETLQKAADHLGIKKAEFVKNLVINYVIQSEKNQEKKK
jgi:metal-responsive CopG/Arc/MetJ family transcriptional regulator